MTTDKTPATLATAKHGAEVRLYQDRSTHNVYRGACGNLPCYCWATEDHVIGDEVPSYAEQQTAKHGGCVQIMPSDAARAFLAAQYRDDGDKAKAIRINHKSLSDSDRRALRAIEAALSAQPSSGGQGMEVGDDR